MFIVSSNKLMIFILFFLILILNNNRINGKFLLNPESSSIIVLRHIRLSTDNEYYRIRCPYHLNHLTVTLLNYSNENCFHLYNKPFNYICNNHRSPCRFHAKSIELNCTNQFYSKYVDITYQCSILSTTMTSTISLSEKSITETTNFTREDEHALSSTDSSNPFTLYALSFPSSSFGIEESVGIFIIGIITVFILWLAVCCIWFMRCSHKTRENDGKCELISIRPYRNSENATHFARVHETKPMVVGKLSNHAHTGGLENIYLHVNPLKNKRLSSLKVTQID